MSKVEVGEEMKALVDMAFEALGKNESKDVFRRNCSIIGGEMKTGLEAAGMVDVFEKYMNFAVESGFIKMSWKLEELLEHDIELMLPKTLSMPAAKVQEFFASGEYDVVEELGLLGSSVSELGRCLGCGGRIYFRTLRMLTRIAGVELSKYVGVENINFGDGYSLSECYVRMNNIPEVLEGKRGILELSK